MKVIAWDFDGVLNRSWVEGADVCAHDFQRDIGHSLQSFYEHVFADGFHRVIVGREDVRDRVAKWVDMLGVEKSAEQILDYWFRKDANPDAEIVGLMEHLAGQGVRQVIATNNEARRTKFIAEDMGFGARVERVFASGHIGISKPDPGFFAHVTSELDVTPADIILIDDREPNVIAAKKFGWQAFHFTDDTRQALSGVLAAFTA